MEHRWELISSLVVLENTQKTSSVVNLISAQVNTVPFSETLLSHKVWKHFISIYGNEGIRKCYDLTNFGHYESTKTGNTA